MAARSSPSSNNKKWQEEEEKELWKMHKEEVSIGDISAALKRTSGAIKSRLAMLSVRGCPVAGCTKLFNNERGRKVHCANTKDAAHTAARQQKANEDPKPKKAAKLNEEATGPTPAIVAQPDSVDTVDTVDIDAAEEDEKMQSEDAKSQTLGTESSAGWSPMVFTQMEVKVKKPGTTVLVNDESWNSDGSKVDFKYSNGKGTVYSGWKWKFTEKEQPTGEEALQAMASQIQYLQQRVYELEGTLNDQEGELRELRQMRECQMALFDQFHKGMENLKISAENE